MKPLERGEALLCVAKVGNTWFDQFGYVEADGAFRWWYHNDEEWTPWEYEQSLFLSEFANTPDFHIHRFWL